MGIYYKAFINKLVESYSYEDFDVFLESDKVKKLYEEFKVTEGNLYWAVNIEKFADEVDVKSSHKLTIAKQILDENLSAWENNE